MKQLLSYGTVLVLFILCLMAWRDLSIDNPPEVICGNWPCEIYVTVRDFQTLIGGVLALIAAGIATRPAWLQLKSMSLQQEIMSRDMIAQRLSLIENRSSESIIKISVFLNEAVRNIVDPYNEAEFDSSDIDAHWSFNMAQEARDLLSMLRVDQKSLNDTSGIEKSRRNLISALDGLEDCFVKICAPAQYAGDHEVSEEQMANMENEEIIARSELPDQLSEAFQAKLQLQKTIDLEITLMRERLRYIDDMLLK